MKTRSLMPYPLILIVTLLSLTACDLPGVEGKSKAAMVACTPGEERPKYQVTEDTPLEDVIDAFNKDVISEKPWGFFVLDAAMIRESIQLEYSNIDKAFRPDFDSILNGIFTRHASLSTYGADASCFTRFEDGTSKGSGGGKAFRVRLEVNYSAEELGIPAGQAAGAGYAVRVGNDMIEGSDGNPQPEPFPTPTDRPNSQSSSNPRS